MCSKISSSNSDWAFNHSQPIFQSSSESLGLKNFPIQLPIISRYGELS